MSNFSAFLHAGLLHVWYYGGEGGVSMDLKGWKRRIAAAGLAALTLGAPVLSPSPIAPFAAVIRFTPIVVIHRSNNDINNITRGFILVNKK